MNLEIRRKVVEAAATGNGILEYALDRVASEVKCVEFTVIVQ